MSDLFDRITEYVLHGGLYNPELMQHEKVRELLIDCRDEIERLRLTDEERAAIEESMRQNVESDCISTGKAQEINATLRSLLSRLK